MEKFQSEEFKREWERWKQYKKEQHRFTYRGTISEAAALTRLFNLSNGNEKNAIELIENAIACGWKGIFQIKNNNGNTNTSTGNSARDRQTAANASLIEKLKRVTGADTKSSSG